MINEQSQQVFRNCIDKYSHNVCFLSSCTNNQKVIESIQSRLTLISLPNITNTILYSIFQNIIETENISIDKDAIDFIVNVSNKTIKNLINYAEKCKLLNTHIDYELSLKICSDIDIHMFDSYATNVNLKYPRCNQYYLRNSGRRIFSNGHFKQLFQLHKNVRFADRR